jgi:hypothetical protein
VYLEVKYQSCSLPLSTTGNEHDTQLDVITTSATDARQKNGIAGKMSGPQNP